MQFDICRLAVLEQLASNLWIKCPYGQLASRLLTSCSRLADCYHRAGGSEIRTDPDVGLIVQLPRFRLCMEMQCFSFKIILD